MSEPTRNVRGTEVRPLLLGDGAYLNLPWLIKPYPHNRPLTASQTNYNRKVSAARSAVVRGFGLLKARWRVLLKRLDNKFHNAGTITVVWCVLHNYCQSCDDLYDDEEFLEEVIQRERRYAANRPFIRVTNADGDRTRESIREYLNP